jgi:excisionase family DNA binding protein
MREIEPGRFVSIPQAGRLYGLSPNTVRRKIEAGEVKAYRLGRTVRVDLVELDAALIPVTAGGHDAAA